MAQKVEFKDSIPFPADVVLEKVLDMDFIEKWSVVQDAINPKATIVDKTDDVAKIKVTMEEPIPTLGNIKAQIDFTWDLKTRKCPWVRTAEGMGAKSNVSGYSEIIPDGDDACYFVDVINIEVKIPVIGKKMEKMVVKHMQSERTKKMDFLIKNLG